MSQHTVGPWRVSAPDQAIHRWVVSSADDTSIADCSPMGPWMSEAEADANARLCAAAPELLAALKGLMPEGEAWYDGTMDHMPGIAAARAAIKKAEAMEEKP